MSDLQTYIALLRGINVGGHHKVPMAELRKNMEQMGFKNIKTLLNSGNVIFDKNAKNEAALKDQIAARLEQAFGFAIPVLLRTAEDICTLMSASPFAGVNITKTTRLYVSFLQETTEKNLKVPWISDDGSFRIIRVQDRVICSILDISIANTPKAMAVLQQIFGKDITTRNWNTLIKIGKKLG